MKYVAISDTHGCHRHLDLPSGDVLIHAGDVCDRGDQSQTDDFFDWLAKLDFAHKLLIWGNHDFDIADNRLLFPSTIPDGIAILDHCEYRIGKTKIFGVPTPPDKQAENWDAIPLDTNIVVTHRPPKGIQDVSRLRGSQGSKRLTKRIAEVQPAMHVFGHIHRSYGETIKNGTRFINASLYRSSKKRLVNAPIAFEFG